MTDLVGASRAREDVGGADGRLSSGQRRLDLILDGGLPDNAITLIAGLPGSGKTILAQQYIFQNATEERPAVYLTTVAEPIEKILRYGQSLAFFDPLAVGSRVFYDMLGPRLHEGGLSAALAHVIGLIKERRPGVIVIDSFKALAAYAQNEVEFRQFLHDLAGWLSAFPAACFWVGEYRESEIGELPEFAVADAILELGTTRTRTRELRSLRVHKLRGSRHASGTHTYRIGEQGLDVYPRLADLPDRSTYELDARRQSTGIDALDRMLIDGYWTGSSTLCAGPSGAGKTLLGLHYVFEGARVGEPGIIASLQESPTQLERIAHGFGWSIGHPKVRLLYSSPVDIHIDQWVYTLLDAIDQTGARRILIDSLTDLQFAAGDEIRFREFMYSLGQRCSREGVSLFMTSDVPDLFRIDALSAFGISQLADNVVLLQYLRDRSTIRRTLTVLKTRASSHRPEIREFTITGEGILLGDPVEPEDG